MYLQRITLHNFKCFEDISIDFNKKLTVIVGINGAGKTSILEGISIALSTMFTPLDGARGRGIDKSQARLKAYTMGSTSDVQPQYPVNVSATAVFGNNQIEWERSLNTAKGSTTIKEAKDIISIAEEYQQRLRSGDTTLVLPILAYYGTGRLWDYHREKQSDVFESSTRTNGYIDSVDGTANIKLMMNWFAKMTVQKYQNQENGLDGIPELEAVFSAMEKCYRRITGIDDVKIQYNMGTKELDISYTDETGAKMRIPINQLSDGYKSTISLVADIAYRMAVLNPQLLGDICSETDGVVLIDEVDLHLHPSWQQRIIGDLTSVFPKVQFIVTTHAPAVINTIRSENLVMLDNHDVYYPSGEVYGKDVNTILRGAMRTDERPIEIKALFDKFYTLLANGDYDKAEDVLDTLESAIKNDDADLAACRLKLKLRKHRGAQS